MKKTLAIGIMALLVFGIGNAFGEEPEDIHKYTECFYCGMNRAKFAHSRMLLKYDDGSALGTCSIRCTAVDMAFFIDKAPTTLHVGDYNTKKLIDAENAFWVIGGDKMGVMTKRAKWAFEKKSDAEQFIKAHSGQIATFEEAMEAAYADMYADNKMIREKRRMMHEKKVGKKK